ncbi:MAG: SpoIIE family protein phosphatase [Leptospiraceae bacterium]|nr:SpoIIE family protein phosphatase [Leptospiraceae bacterium]MCP5513816.1 SpoIIE family protein phosphatase [Leptospiraceae bacterium]
MKEFFTFLLSFFLVSSPSDERIDLKNLHWEMREISQSASNSEWFPIQSMTEPIQSLYPEKNGWGFFEFRTRFDLPDSFLNNHSPPALYFISIGEVFSIFVNNEKIASEGYFENDHKFQVRSLRSYTSPINSRILKSQNNELIIQISGDLRGKSTGFFYPGEYILSTYEDILSLRQDLIGDFLNYFYILFSFYHLYLFLTNKSERHNLNIFFLGSITCLYFIVRSTSFQSLKWDTEYFLRLEYSSLMLTLPALLYFQEYLLRGKINLVARVFKWMSILLSLSCWIFYRYYLEDILFIWKLICVVSPLIIFYSPISEFRKKNPDAIIILFGLSIVSLVLFIDLYLVTFQKNHTIYSKYTFFFYFLSLGVLIANRMTRLNGHIQFLNEVLNNKITVIEDLNKNLELKVEKRTRELSLSLIDIERLKEKQDGDYFLITLIADPLYFIQFDKNYLDISTILNQYKKFSFKSKEYQIGGDLIIVETIPISDKNYTIFINGDAMGKSLQGATGAIVLGVVFKSLINTRRYSEQIANNSPEFTLKNIFIDLQKVFESFDGLMLCSALIGLIDTETGCLYSINAEHPYTVLYRNKKAEFLDLDNSLYKLGTSWFQKGIHVIVKQLFIGDVILTGSDGREDILIRTELNQYSINENSNLFLEAVENSLGDSENIFKYLQSRGNFTDDFSLIRIQILGLNTGESHKILSLLDDIIDYHELFKEKDRIEDYLENIFLNTLKSDYDKIRVKEVLSDLFPYHIHHLETLRNLYSSIGRYEDAASIGERIRIRDPYNKENLVSLLNLYKNLKYHHRLPKLIDKINALDSKT